MSSSGSSSSRRRRPSHHHDLRSYRVLSYPTEWEYEGEPIFCYCNLKTVRRTAWRTEDNIGRRFYGCQLFPAERACNFLYWHDPYFPHRAREIITELKERELFLYNQAISLNAEVSDLRSHAIDIVQEEIIKENWLLKKELTDLKRSYYGDLVKYLKIAACVCLCAFLISTVVKVNIVANGSIRNALP